MIYPKKATIVMYEKIKDKITLEKFNFIKSKLSVKYNLYAPKTDTANKVGMDNKNEILAAFTLSNLRNLAAVIAMPDLLTPGTKEKICKKPMIKADLRSRLISRLFSFSILSEKYNNIPNNTVVQPISFSDLKSLIIPDSAIR